MQLEAVWSLELTPKDAAGSIAWPSTSGLLHAWRYPRWVMTALEVYFRPPMRERAIGVRWSVRVHLTSGLFAFLFYLT